MKLTKRQLKRIIKEEKAKILKEYGQHSPGDVIAAVEKGLAALMLQKVLADPDGSYEADEIYSYMYDIGYEDIDVQRAIDQLADRYNMK